MQITAQVVQTLQRTLDGSRFAARCTVNKTSLQMHTSINSPCISMSVRTGKQSAQCSGAPSKIRPVEQPSPWVKLGCHRGMVHKHASLRFGSHSITYTLRLHWCTCTSSDTTAAHMPAPTAPTAHARTNSNNSTCQHQYLGWGRQSGGNQSQYRTLQVVAPRG